MTLFEYMDAVSKYLMLGKASAPPALPNFPLRIVSQISRQIGMIFISQEESGGNVCLANSEEVRPEYRTTFSSVDLLNYFYAVFHSSYCRAYGREVFIELSGLPYPKGAEHFWRLAEMGGQLRRTHLLESPLISHYTTRYPIDGDNEVSKPRFVPAVIARRGDEAIPPSGTEGNQEAIPYLGRGRVYINDSQYFDQVPELAWNFYIGGGQPAQRWLKDRKGRKLGFEDILHYQKIIAALAETDRLMKEIDGVGTGEKP